jgi:hypothetical protein
MAEKTYLYVIIVSKNSYNRIGNSQIASIHKQCFRTRKKAIVCLKRCFNERDLALTKQVHNQMMTSRME